MPISSYDQTAETFSDHPEKRSPIAMEMASSEVEYNRLLRAIKNVYFKPLNAALKSNRFVSFCYFLCALLYLKRSGSNNVGTLIRL